MRRLVAVERLKLRTIGVPTAALVAAGLIALAATLNAIAAADVDPAEPVLRGPGFRVFGAPASSRAAVVEDARDVLSAWSLVLVVTYSLGVAAAAVERRHGTLASSLLAVPVRWRLVTAKLVAVAEIAVLVGIVALVVALIVGGGWVSGEDVPTDLDALAIVAAAATGVCALVLAGALGLGVGFFVSAPATGIVAGVAMLVAVEPAVASRSESVARFLPVHAADGAFGPLGSLVSTDTVPAAAGLAVLLAWAAASLLAATRFLATRDLA